MWTVPGTRPANGVRGRAGEPVVDRCRHGGGWASRFLLMLQGFGASACRAPITLGARACRAPISLGASACRAPLNSGRVRSERPTQGPDLLLHPRYGVGGVPLQDGLD